MVLGFLGKAADWDSTLHDLQLCFGVRDFLVRYQAMLLFCVMLPFVTIIKSNFVFR